MSKEGGSGIIGEKILCNQLIGDINLLRSCLSKWRKTSFWA